MAKHTPGPWVLGNFTGDGCGIDSATTSEGVAFVRGLEGVDGFSVDARKPNANARLIAVAPEMYDALSILIEDGECYCSYGVANRNPCGHCAARAVIAKVTKK